MNWTAFLVVVFLTNLVLGCLFLVLYRQYSAIEQQPGEVAKVIPGLVRKLDSAGHRTLRLIDREQRLINDLKSLIKHDVALDEKHVLTLLSDNLECTRSLSDLLQGLSADIESVKGELQKTPPDPPGSGPGDCPHTNPTAENSRRLELDNRRMQAAGTFTSVRVGRVGVQKRTAETGNVSDSRDAAWQRHGTRIPSPCRNRTGHFRPRDVILPSRSAVGGVSGTATLPQRRGQDLLEVSPPLHRKFSAVSDHRRRVRRADHVSNPDRPIPGIRAGRSVRTAPGVMRGGRSRGVTSNRPKLRR